MIRIHTPFRAALLLALSAPVARGQSSTDRSLDSLLATPVSSASKHAQDRAAAPASITIITADQIRDHGYTSLEEMLEGVTGFYVSNDRNYPSLGVRGFSRPGDFNNRVLILIDGHTLNEQIWGSTPVGTDLPLPLEAINRVEIVRGPNSVAYGSSAMFAVINIVTRNGVQIDGGRLSARIGSAAAREVSGVAGMPFGPGRSFAIGMLAGQRDGNDLHYAEFEGAGDGGVARGLDWERRQGVFAKLRWGEAAVRAGFRNRDKGIPTASYGTRFGDPRAATGDLTTWIDGSLDLQLGQESQHRLRLRGYMDYYRYHGTYPADAGPAYTDRARSTAHGAEAVSIWEPASWIRVATGLEIRGVVAATYEERLADGTVVRADAPFRVISGWTQAEAQVTPAIALIGGLGHTYQSATRRATTPRLALVAQPDRLTSIKMLFGQAFRAPSPSEADMSTGYFTPNPALRPERLTSLEVSAERRVRDAVLLGLSAFRYDISGLIDQTATEPAQFVNVGRTRTLGTEGELRVEPAHWISGRLAHAFQRAERSDGSAMTNSPERITTGSVTAAVGLVRPSVMVRHETGRVTIAGNRTPAFTRADANVLLLSPDRTPWRGDVSIRVTNLLGATYYVPGGFEHAQDMIAQDGRVVSLRLTWAW